MSNARELSRMFHTSFLTFVRFTTGYDDGSCVNSWTLFFYVSRVTKFREDYDTFNRNFAQLKSREEQVHCLNLDSEHLDLVLLGYANSRI